MSLDCRPPLKRNIEDGVSDLPVAMTPVPRVFEKALPVPDLLNPRATIGFIEPLEFEPGERIDLSVSYTPANDEEIRWQTVVVAKRGADVLVQEKQHHLSMNPSELGVDVDTGLTMPSTPVTIEIEVWAHPDYLETTEPY